MQIDTYNPGDKKQWTVGEGEDGLRLDQWLAECLGGDGSRSAVQKWIREGYVTSSGKSVRASTRIRPGEVYSVVIPEPVVPDLTPVEMDFRVFYEDDDLAVIVKPPGIAVHPGPGDSGRTLVNGILHRWGHIEGGESFRPGIVHRLDMPTEGLLIVAKNERSHRELARQFQGREVKKEYCAWLLSTPKELEGTIDQPIARDRMDRMKMRVDPAGRRAITHYAIEKSVTSKKGRKFSFARIEIITGRTHQIRVHMAHIGAPVVGDPFYSRSHKEFEKFGLLLLARRIQFHHPVTGKPLQFEMELPERFHSFERKCPNY